MNRESFAPSERCKLVMSFLYTRQMQSINRASLKECWTVCKNSFEDVLSC